MIILYDVCLLQLAGFCFVLLCCGEVCRQSARRLLVIVAVTGSFWGSHQQQRNRQSICVVVYFLTLVFKTISLKFQYNQYREMGIFIVFITYDKIFNIFIISSRCVCERDTFVTAKQRKRDRRMCTVFRVPLQDFLNSFIIVIVLLLVLLLLLFGGGMLYTCCIL